MSKMENTFAWGRITDKDIENYLSNYYNKSEIDNLVNNLSTKVNQNDVDITQLNENQAELWNYLDTQYLTDKGLGDLAAKVIYDVPRMDRNRPYTNGVLLPYTFEGRKVYQFLVRFNTSNGGEANLINGTFSYFYDVSIINAATKALIKPEDWNLRYNPGEAIRATIPQGSANYIFICKIVE